MTRKLTLALAALATLAGAALVSSDDAHAFRGGGMRGGGGIARAHVGNVGMRHVNIRHGGLRHVNIRHGGLRPHFRPHFRFAHRHHHRWPHGHWCWRFPWRCGGVGIGVVGASYVAPTYVASTPTYAASPSRCTCLTKEYQQDGSVLFRDVCTKEEALMPNPNQQQSQAPYTQPSQSAYYQAPQNYQPQPAYQGQVPYQGQPAQ